MDTSSKVVYLTFDDGPIPACTPQVLDILARYQAKATFFMVAENAARYPDLVARVCEGGHTVGNHTFHHMRGYQSSTQDYVADALLGEKILQTKLFRPPHGFMRPSQFAAVKDKYTTVMWDVVTRDYSRNLDGEQVLDNVRRYTRNGSIIVFHDSLKAEKNLHYALPRAIEWLLDNGYQFETL